MSFRSISTFQSSVPSWPESPSFNSRINMSGSSPKPKWFISRGNGVYTALIPADELPYSVNLYGVSATMTVDQVVGMTLVAETGPSGQRFVLDKQSPFPAPSKIDSAFPSPIAPLAKQFFAPDAHVNIVVPPQEPVSTGAEKAPEVAKIEEPKKAVVEILPRPDSSASVSTDNYYPTQRPLPPSGQEPDETKKVFCSYWMHHGSCDYTQQGCKYKHEMPTDRRTLLSLGFRATPKWYLEEQAAKKVHLKMATPQNARISASTTTLPAKSSHNTTADSSAGKGSRTPVREEPNIKRSRFTDTLISTPDGLDRRENVPTSKTTIPVVKLAPPVMLKSSSKSEPSDLNKSVNVAETTTSKPESLNLIDLSDSDGDCSTIKPSSAPSTRSGSPQSAPPSPFSSMSASSSDTETVIEPQTPPTSNATLDTSTKDKGIFIPPGESPQYHRERVRTQHHRFPKRSSHKSTFKTTVSRGKKADTATTGSPKVVAVIEKNSVAPSSRGHTTGLDASVHATSGFKTGS